MARALILAGSVELLLAVNEGSVVASTHAPFLGDDKNGALGAEASLISIAKVVVAREPPASKTVLAVKDKDVPMVSPKPIQG